MVLSLLMMDVSGLPRCPWELSGVMVLGNIRLGVPKLQVLRLY
jgi:hypothetical protein